MAKKLDDIIASQKSGVSSFSISIPDGPARPLSNQMLAPDTTKKPIRKIKPNKDGVFQAENLVDETLEEASKHVISRLNNTKVDQPPVYKKPYRRPVKGGERARQRLADLKFDPIGELVKQYKKLEIEVYYQEQLRAGLAAELNTHGKHRQYRAEIHMMLYDKLINIGTQLIRYGYGRVPEVLTIEQKKSAPLIVNLALDREHVINAEPVASNA